MEEDGAAATKYFGGCWWGVVRQRVSARPALQTGANMLFAAAPVHTHRDGKWAFAKS